MRLRVFLVATLLATTASAHAGPLLEKVADDRPRSHVAAAKPAPAPRTATPTVTGVTLEALHEAAVADAEDDFYLVAKDDLPRDPDVAAAPTTRGLVASAVGTAGIYAALYGWLTAAWWVRTTDSGEFQFHDEGWFGRNTYAGGADKLGHFWGNYAVTRGVAQILHHGGWDKRGSTLVAGALSLGFFAFSEVKDGYKQEYGFSYGDMIANTTGVLVGVGLELSPTIDRHLDIRISYKPSQLYLDRLQKDGPFNTPEDYTGQTFLLAYHLGAIDYLREHASWTRYFDVNLGYAAVNYKPIPEDGAVAQQELFIGGSINLQAVADEMLGRKSLAGGMVNFVTEVFQPPYTTLRAGQLDRTGIPEPEGPTARVNE